jgi:hypothetical protein
VSALGQARARRIGGMVFASCMSLFGSADLQRDRLKCTLGRRHLEHVLRVYHRHYNEHRPHRALRLVPSDGCDPTPLYTTE